MRLTLSWQNSPTPKNNTFCGITATNEGVESTPSFFKSALLNRAPDSTRNIILTFFLIFTTL